MFLILPKWGLQVPAPAAQVSLTHGEWQLLQTRTKEAAEGLWVAQSVRYMPSAQVAPRGVPCSAGSLSVPPPTHACTLSLSLK